VYRHRGRNNEQIEDLVALAKAKPGKLKFGSSGAGTGTHVGAEKFNKAAGIEARHVPPESHDSNADTIADAIAGRFSVLFRLCRKLLRIKLREFVDRPVDDRHASLVDHPDPDLLRIELGLVEEVFCDPAGRASTAIP
jgi:hypothetical protein